MWSHRWLSHKCLTVTLSACGRDWGSLWGGVIVTDAWQLSQCHVVLLPLIVREYFSSSTNRPLLITFTAGRILKCPLCQHISFFSLLLIGHYVKFNLFQSFQSVICGGVGWLSAGLSILNCNFQVWNQASVTFLIVWLSPSKCEYWPGPKIYW